MVSEEDMKKERSSGEMSTILGLGGDLLGGDLFSPGVQSGVVRKLQDAIVAVTTVFTTQVGLAPSITCL